MIRLHQIFLCVSECAVSHEELSPFEILFPYIFLRKTFSSVIYVSKWTFPGSRPGERSLRAGCPHVVSYFCRLIIYLSKAMGVFWPGIAFHKFSCRLSPSPGSVHLSTFLHVASFAGPAGQQWVAAIVTLGLEWACENWNYWQLRREQNCLVVTLTWGVLLLHVLQTHGISPWALSSQVLLCSSKQSKRTWPITTT